MGTPFHDVAFSLQSPTIVSRDRGHRAPEQIIATKTTTIQGFPARERQNCATGTGFNFSCLLKLRCLAPGQTVSSRCVVVLHDAKFGCLFNAAFRLQKTYLGELGKVRLSWNSTPSCFRRRFKALRAQEVAENKPCNWRWRAFTLRVTSQSNNNGLSGERYTEERSIF
jgi:hypothetical protein